MQKFISTILISTFIASTSLLVTGLLTPAFGKGNHGIEIQAQTDGISVVFDVQGQREVLTFSVRVVGPGHFVFEQRIEGSSLHWIPPGDLRDGIYQWEAWVVTADPGAPMRKPNPALSILPADHWYDSEFKQTHLASGSFRVENALLEEADQLRNEDEGQSVTRRVASAILDFLIPAANAEERSDENARGETFDDFVSILNPSGTGLTRLNLSGSGGNDTFWRVVNDSDATNRFEIREGFPGTARMVIRQGGNIGVGTNNPLSPIHIDRLGGFQIRLVGSGADYRMDSFGTSFRIGHTNTNNQFRIFEDAAFNSLVLGSGGNIGVGTSAPAASLHIQRADNSAQVRVEESGAGNATLLNLLNNGHVRFRMDNTATGDNWEFRTTGDGPSNAFSVNKIGTPSQEFRVFGGGNVLIAGTLTQGSSRTIKERISEITVETVLAKLEALPVHEWSYQTAPGQRHAGPMAEDFYAAFGLGVSNKHIAPGDLAGIALAAAKALYQRNQELETRLNLLEAAIMEQD